MQDQKPKTLFERNINFSGDLTDPLTREIKVPGVEEILKSVKAALSAASKTIKESNLTGGQCGCF